MPRAVTAGAPARILQTLFSFEALYFVVLFSGRIGASYKENALVGLIPLDPTLLASIAVLVVGAYVLWKRGWQVSRQTWFVVAPGLAFTTWATLSAAWSPSEVYVQQKAVEAGLVLTLAILGGAIVIAEKPHRLVRFAHLVLVFGTGVGLVVLGGFIAAKGVGFSTAFDINRLAIARVVGFASIVAMWGLLSISAHTSRARWPYGVAFALTFVSLLMTGTRMPLIATMVALGFVLVMRRDRVALAIREHRSVAIALAVLTVLAIAGAGFYYVSIGDAPKVVERMAGLILDPGGETNVVDRLEWYGPSTELWLERPIAGQGLGSWPILNGYPDERMYPHSIVLETLSETGVVGFALLAVFVAAAAMFIGKGLRGRDRELAILVGALLVAAALNALVTGDLGDNRFVFGFAALACAFLHPDIHDSLGAPS